MGERHMPEQAVADHVYRQVREPVGREQRLVLAAPVVASDAVPVLRAEVDDLVYVLAPDDFLAVGIWYEQFGQTTDEEVASLLERARRALASRALSGDRRSLEPRGNAADPPPAVEREVAMSAGATEVRGNLSIPTDARGIVLFAHGSGSSRFSRRNRHVARVLSEAGLATLLLDLLTADEEAEDHTSGRLRFGIDFLAKRLDRFRVETIEKLPGIPRCDRTLG